MRPLNLLILLAGTIQAGEIPFAAANWQASPTDPVGFAGQGNFWYPGATPPTEFWEGTPVEAEVKNAKGATSKQWTYGDQKARNILWKAALPGGSDSQPLVVGNRVVCLSTPHFVTCYDADTGKVLWQDELKLLTLPALSADRKSVGPAPAAAAAAPQQELFERALGWWRVRLGATAIARDARKNFAGYPAERKVFMEAVAKDLELWKNELKTAFPDIGPTLDGEIATLRDLAADRKPAEGLKQSTVKPYAGGAPPTWSSSPALVQYAAAKTGVPVSSFTNHWQGHMTDTMATPVSDGEIVGVTFGLGQIAAYDLATGKRLWGWRDPQMSPAGASHCPSPLLWKDLLIVPGGGASKSEGYTMSLMGIDKRTGALRWESSRGPGGPPATGTHGDHMSPALVRLPDGKGGIRALVVGNQGAVIDAETGAKMGQFPSSVGATAENPVKNDYWGSGFIGFVNNTLYKCYGGDHSAPPVNMWTLSLTPEGGLVIGAGLKSQSRGASHSPFALSPTILATSATLINPVSGETLATIDRSMGGTPVLAGNRLLTITGMGERKSTTNVIDVSDPAKPKRLNAKPNLLGDGSLPIDISDRYFPSLKNPEFKRFCLGTYMGIKDGFGHEVGGVACRGGRIYIKSQTHIYAIGEK